MTPASNHRSRPTILVVDDEPEMLRSVFDLLRLDYRPLTLRSPAEAIEALKDDPTINVILSDQRMPEMSGVSLLREAKRIRPEVTRLLFTGYADINAVIDAINQGNVFRYIAKPWEPAEMLSVIKQAVDQHGLISEKMRLLVDLEATNARLREASRLKGAFLEVASHELNTPVAVVLGLTELWKLTLSKDATPTERNWVNTIQGAGRRLAATVERMFKLIRSDQPNLALQRSEIDLSQLIDRVIDELQPFLAARNQVVDRRLDDDLGFVEGDQAKLADVFANLIGNAIKFTPDGGRVLVTGSAVDADWVEVGVTDRGKGICDEDRNHLFEPFFTGYDTLHHSSGDYQYGKRGIGLGLCLVKTFVELHGGQASCTSNPGSGSVFQVRLPRRTKLTAMEESAKELLPLAGSTA